MFFDSSVLFPVYNSESVRKREAVKDGGREGEQCLVLCLNEPYKKGKPAQGHIESTN